jgi:hypothetical protein
MGILGNYLVAMETEFSELHLVIGVLEKLSETLRLYSVQIEQPFRVFDQGDVLLVVEVFQLLYVLLEPVVIKVAPHVKLNDIFGTGEQLNEL